VIAAPHASIAVFRALQVGDMLCAMPALTGLRRAYPDASITLISLPWASELLRRFPDVLNEHLALPGVPGLPEQPADPIGLGRFVESMRARRFDLVLQMHGNGTVVNPLVASFEAQRTVAFSREMEPASAGTMETIPYREDLHEIERMLTMTRYLGIADPPDDIGFVVSGEEERIAGLLLARLGVDGRYVCLHPGARDPARRWPTERFALVGDHLAHEGYTVILTGVESERTATTAVARAMRAPAHNLAGLTALGTLGALVRGAALLVCNDTGISHIAAATRTPSVVIFSASSPERWAPLDAQRHRAVHGPRIAATAFEPAPARDVIDAAMELLEAGVPYAA
jgi:ADP-heptose:LPS heptosyltransferase